VGKNPFSQRLEISSSEENCIKWLREISSRHLGGFSGFAKFIRLETPMRTNQKGYKKQPYIFRKSRKRIETLYSQLCDQFLIRRNYAKTFLGFKTRILSKITALTIVQYINRFINNRPINFLKHAI
jgi:hypothetical protein